MYVCVCSTHTYLHAMLMNICLLTNNACNHLPEKLYIHILRKGIFNAKLAVRQIDTYVNNTVAVKFNRM